MTAALGFGLELVGQGGQDAGLVFGLGGQQDRGPQRLQVQDRPQAGRDVQHVQAQVMRLPARAERGGQVAVAGPVDLLDPGAQPGDGFGSCVGREVPPLRRRFGVVAVGVGAVRGAVSSVRTAACSSRVRLSRVSCSWWAASWSRIAAIGSLLAWSVPEEGAGGHVTGDDRFGPPGRGRELARRTRRAGGGRGGRRGCARRGAAGR